MQKKIALKCLEKCFKNPPVKPDDLQNIFYKGQSLIDHLWDFFCLRVPQRVKPNFLYNLISYFLSSVKIQFYSKPRTFQNMPTKDCGDSLPLNICHQRYSVCVWFSNFNLVTINYTFNNNKNSLQAIKNCNDIATYTHMQKHMCVCVCVKPAQK